MLFKVELMEVTVWADFGPSSVFVVFISKVSPFMPCYENNEHPHVKLAVSLQNRLFNAYDVRFWSATSPQNAYFNVNTNLCE